MPRFGPYRTAPGRNYNNHNYEYGYSATMQTRVCSYITRALIFVFAYFSSGFRL